MQIAPSRRTREVLNSPYGRSLTNFEKPKALTKEEKEKMLEKEKQKQKFFADLKASAEQTDRQKQQDLIRAREEEVERRRRENEELRQENLAASFGYGRPAPRPPYFVNPPNDEKLNDDCLLCQQSLSSFPVAFCRYCRSVMHLSCYNELTPEQRKSLFTEQGLCRICKNGLKQKDVRNMEVRRIVDDPTYFRWPPEAVFNFVSPDEKAAADRMLREKQDGEYAQAVAKDFVLPVISDEELREAMVARQQQEQQEKLDEVEIRRMRLAAFEEYKKRADADKAAEMEMHARAATPLFPSLQRPPAPVPAAAAFEPLRPLRDDDLDLMLSTPPDPLYPSSSSKFQQRVTNPSNLGSFRVLNLDESQKAMEDIMLRRVMKQSKEKKGGKQNKYSKKKYIKRHSKKRHSKKRHSKKRSKSMK
jgi:hypothetical protein